MHLGLFCFKNRRLMVIWTHLGSKIGLMVIWTHLGLKSALAPHSASLAPNSEYKKQPAAEYSKQPAAEYSIEPAAEYSKQPAAEYLLKSLLAKHFPLSHTIRCVTPNILNISSKTLVQDPLWYFVQP
jgi:hypothetical protein